MDDKFFNELREKIQPYFEDSGSHDFSHTERVLLNALNISENEGIDLDIVTASALLHDIARLEEQKNPNLCHADKGAEIANQILLNSNFPKEKIEKVCECIKYHRYSKGLVPELKEAKILQDADRLDALGAICIARIFHYGGRLNRKMHDSKLKAKTEYNSDSDSCLIHFYEKILKITPESFHTIKAREIAKSRYNYTQEYVNQFINEWEGKR